MKDYKEPTKQEDLNRERNSTTLKQCGWCEFASGMHRYNYCIEGKCHLDKSYSKDVHWDTPCKFSNASKYEIKSIIDSHKYEIDSCKGQIKSHENYIKKLLTLKKTAVKRPALPDDRETEHFKLGVGVAVYFDDKWHFGKVVSGYRTYDGCVSYDLDDYPKKGIGCGNAVPIVMLKSEYDWFKENPKEYLIWCDKAYKESYNGNKLDVAPIN